MTVQRAALVLVLAALAAGSSCEEKPAGCDFSEDCQLGEDCIDNLCIPAAAKECMADGDCANGKACVESVCVPRSNRLDAGIRRDGGGSDGGPTGTATIELSPPDVLDFGSPVVGLDIPKSVIIKNLGPGNLWIYSVGRTSGTSEEFTLSTSTPIPRLLEVDAEMRVTVTYRLADGEADTGSITITSDAAACSFLCETPNNVRLQLFSEFKGIRNLDVQPSLHDYGFIPQGMSSDPFSFVARNDGTQTKLLTLQNLTLDGPDAIHFSIAGSVVAPSYLQPASEFPIPVTYTPLNSGNHSAELVVRANSDNPARQELRVTVTGRSVPSVDISATAVDFGHVMLNQMSTRTTTITNNSNVAVTVTSAAFLNGSSTQNFFVPPPSPLPVLIAANGGTAQVSVLFAPLGMAGSRNDTLRLAHSLSASPVNVGLSGIADPLPPPPGGPDLSMAMEFTRDDVGENGCNATSLNNWQNMDLILEGGGATCEKPATQAEANARCGGSDNVCSCVFGTQGGATWRAQGGTAPEPYAQEAISHNQAGGDGTFVIRNRYVDDCASDWSSNSAAIIQGICGYGGLPPLRYICFPQEQYSYLYIACGESGPPYNGYCISETQCLNAAQGIANSSCNARRPSKAKTIVTIKSATGAIVEQRAFCRTFGSASATKQDVVNLTREQGFFRITSMASGVTEVAVNAACP